MCFKALRKENKRRKQKIVKLTKATTKIERCISNTSSNHYGFLIFLTSKQPIRASPLHYEILQPYSINQHELVRSKQTIRPDNYSLSNMRNYTLLTRDRVRQLIGDWAKTLTTEQFKLYLSSSEMPRAGRFGEKLWESINLFIYCRQYLFTLKSRCNIEQKRWRSIKCGRFWLSGVEILVILVEILSEQITSPFTVSA